jgi:hypothetical protein
MRHQEDVRDELEMMLARWIVQVMVMEHGPSMTTPADTTRKEMGDDPPILVPFRRRPSVAGGRDDPATIDAAPEADATRRRSA